MSELFYFLGANPIVFGVLSLTILMGGVMWDFSKWHSSESSSSSSESDV